MLGAVMAHKRLSAIKDNHSHRVCSMRLACERMEEMFCIDVFESIPSNYPRRHHERTRVSEIVMAGPHEILVIVTASGLARAFDLTTGVHLGFLNPSAEDTVHTVLYNRYNSTLIVVYAPYVGALGCNVLCCWQLKKACLHVPNYTWEFRMIHLTHPAFFEFDETNDRIGVACMETQTFDFWSLSDYKKVFTLRGCTVDRYEEIRVSDSVIVFLKAPRASCIPYALYDIADGRCLSEDFISVLPQREVHFLELCSEYLLLKQDNSSLRIYDLVRHRQAKVADTRNMSPLSFVFFDHPVDPTLHRAYNMKIPRRFFTISEHCIELWLLWDCNATRLKKILFPNLTEPDLVAHSGSHSLVAVCVSANAPLCANFTTALRHYKSHCLLTNTLDHNAEREEQARAQATLPLNPKKTDLSFVENISLLCIKEGELIGTLECPLINVTAIVFSLEQLKLVAGSNSGISRVFGVVPRQLWAPGDEVGVCRPKRIKGAGKVTTRVKRAPCSKPHNAERKC